jgi:hypothetical protein
MITFIGKKENNDKNKHLNKIIKKVPNVNNIDLTLNNNLLDDPDLKSIILSSLPHNSNGSSSISIPESSTSKNYSESNYPYIEQSQKTLMDSEKYNL